MKRPMHSLAYARRQRNRLLRQAATVFVMAAGTVGYFIYAMLGEDW